MKPAAGHAAEISAPWPWHQARGAEVLAIVGSSLETGISMAEAEARLARFGPNALPEASKPSTLLVFFRQFKSPLIYLLIVAAIVAFFLGERGDAAVIIAVLTLNAVIGAFQEGRAERSMQSLRRLAAIHARVLRGGRERTVEARQLVPGDILILAAGDAITADARLLETASFEVSEAALTGEALPITKQADPAPLESVLADRNSMVYAGTHASAGRARAVVVGTGLATEVGKIAALTESATREPKTPLELRIEQFGRYLVAGAAAIFCIILGIGVLRGIRFSDILMVAISQLVSIVPEGLPVAMTIGLAVGMQRMAARRAVVRRLAAVEALGSATVICSDKTGTLTRNEMTVTALWMPDGKMVNVTGVGYAPRGEFRVGDSAIRPLDDSALRRLLEACVLCNDAQLHAPDTGDGPWLGVGDPTEVALLVLGQKAGLDIRALRKMRPRTAELPFSADTKMMATAHGMRVFLKGAPEAILALCHSAWVGPDQRPLNPESTASVRIHAEQMAGRSLRVLAVAAIDCADATPLTPDRLKGRGVLLGLVGQFDPPREEIKAAVAECDTAGIRTVMVTGDHKATGLAIAKALGIAKRGHIAVDGRELESMTEEDLSSGLSKISVFARVHPAQKLRIVRAFQRAGQVVVMTGDGVNDAPALARAEVGVAMGITGTEVAKEASKIVVTDDNFATIVRAVEEGRVVYRNIKKAILLLLSTGAAEVFVLLGGLVAGLPIPFLAVQILWNNVVTEGAITVNLVMEPREGNEMRRPPIPRDEPILTRAMLGRLLLMSVAIATSTLAFFLFQLSRGVPLEYARTTTFTLLAVCEWFNVLNCRSDTKSALSLSVLKNPWLVGGLVVSNILQAAVVFSPALNRIFYTVPIPLTEVFAIGGVGSVVLWVEELRKLLARRANRTVA